MVSDKCHLRSSWPTSLFAGYVLLLAITRPGHSAKIKIPMLESIDKRNAITNKLKLWAGAVVPYVIDSTFFNSKDLKMISDAMDEFHNSTCIRFVRRSSEEPYLYITALDRCWSEIGMPEAPGIRTLSLGKACLARRGTVIHELMHVIGFWHEQNRPDRDKYITVNWDNIKQDLKYNFVRYSANRVDTLGEPYDYGSIMHYAAYAFAKDQTHPTIIPRVPTMIGQRFGLSDGDVRKINKLYSCSSRPLSVAANRGLLGSSPSKVRPTPSPVNPRPPDSDVIVFPEATVDEVIPLPFRFNWS